MELGEAKRLPQAAHKPSFVAQDLFHFFRAFEGALEGPVHLIFISSKSYLLAVP
jgi:hypothetical protein